MKTFTEILSQKIVNMNQVKKTRRALATLVRKAIQADELRQGSQYHLILEEVMK